MSSLPVFHDAGVAVCDYVDDGAAGGDEDDGVDDDHFPTWLFYPTIFPCTRYLSLIPVFLDSDVVGGVDDVGAGDGCDGDDDDVAGVCGDDDTHA